MSDGARRRPFQVVVVNGEPSAVILGIGEYEEYKEMLERLEDLNDLEMLEDMRKNNQEFRRLEEFLEEYSPDV